MAIVEISKLPISRVLLLTMSKHNKCINGPPKFQSEPTQYKMWKAETDPHLHKKLHLTIAKEDDAMKKSSGENGEKKIPFQP